MGDGDFPVPIGVLVAAAVVGVIFIGAAIALCCYFCAPRGNKCRRLCNRSQTAPLDAESQDDTKYCLNCCQAPSPAPWQRGYSPTSSERSRGLILIEPYVITDYNNIQYGKPIVSSQPPPRVLAAPVGRAPESTPVPVSATPRQLLPDTLLFTRQLSDRTLSSYPENVVFECELNKQNVNVIWTRNGFPIDTRRAKPEVRGRIHRLVLERCDLSDEGVYDCTVAEPSRPSTEIIKTSGRLDIRVAPALKIDKYLNKITEVKVGHTIYFHLPFSGHPRPKIFATFNGNPLPDSSRMTISDLGREQIAIFTVSNALRSDSGTYTVIAENEGGRVTGNLQLAVKDRPSVPRDFVMNEITGETCRVSWLKPADDGGSPVEAFTIERSENDSELWQPMGRFPPNIQQASFIELQPNVQYVFRIAAFNKYGVSDWATLGITAKKGVDVPGKPLPPSVAEAVKSRCRVNWNPPLNDGGSPITRYVLEYAEQGTSHWLPVPRQPASTLVPLSIPVANLSEHKKYQFRVAAENQKGLGPFSDPSRPISAKDEFTVPSKPEPPVARDISKNSCRVDWKPPPSDGGSAITSFIVERAVAGTNKWEPQGIFSGHPPLPLSTPVDNISDSQKYQFRVAAENNYGRGPFSDPSVPITAKDQWSPPGRPERPKVTDVLKSQCRLNWEPPLSDGGAPITSYVIQQAQAGTDRWEPVPTPRGLPPTSLAAPVSDLNENESYQFRVAANNKAGTGPFSEPSLPVKPTDPWKVPDRPGKPIVTKVPEQNSLRVTWPPPQSNGGTPIVDYIVEVSPLGKTATPRQVPIGKPILAHTINDVAPDETYVAQVRAVNRVGKSEPSEPSEPVQVKKPSPPPVVVVAEKPPKPPQKEKPEVPPKKVRRKKTPPKPPPPVAKRPLEKPPPPPPPPPVKVERPKPVKRERTPPAPPPPEPPKQSPRPEKRAKPSDLPPSSTPTTPRQVEQVDAGFCNCGPGASAPPPKKSPAPAPKQRQSQPFESQPKQAPLEQPKFIKLAPPPAQPRPEKRVPPPPAYVAKPPVQERKPAVRPPPEPPSKREKPPRQPEKPPPKLPEKPPPKEPGKPQPKQPVQEPSRKIPPGSSLSGPTPGVKRVTFADRTPTTPPPKKPKRDQLDRLLETDRPEFNLYFGSLPLNSLKRFDLSRKITEF